MLLAWLLLLTGLTISAVAIYYSVIGLAAIFAAATIPIYIMGGSLEVAKLVCASWLKANWSRTPMLMKAYMVVAVFVLMAITSMGIFGFLSKAHSDQSLVSGDVTSKIAIYDEKIKTAKENIDANRKALKQMDEAVDQSMGRSTDEKGADKAVAIRKSQQKERSRLLAEITAEQKNISQLSEERAPIAAEVRKVEAEVGPIKYIASFVYGDNPDANLLEKSVTWVIIIIVSVFDPLAVIMLLAAQMTFGWLRDEKKNSTPNYEPDDGPLTKEQIEEIKQSVVVVKSPEMSIDAVVEFVPATPKVEEEKSILESHPYLSKPFNHFTDTTPIVHKPETEVEKISITEQVDITSTISVDSTKQQVDEDTYQILPELEEESKKKTYMIKQQGQQIKKTLD
jgi:hypothetical protein